MIFIRIMMIGMLMKKRAKADQFAQEFLIPTNEYEQFVAEKSLINHPSFVLLMKSVSIQVLFWEDSKRRICRIQSVSRAKISYNIIINGNLM